MQTSLHVFQKTQSALAQAIHVKQIATYNLQTCAPDQSVKDVLEKYPEFDQIPIKENGTVIGVIERNTQGAEEDPAKCVRRLEDSILVSEELPLLEFLPLMASPPYYRLVLAGNRIDAVVTRSDLLKLPVRLLAFTKINQLETAMQELIELRYPDEREWLKLLSEESSGSIRSRRKRAQDYRSDPPLVEFTTFKDKVTIVRWMFGEANPVREHLNQLVGLRNTIVHDGNYAETEELLSEFIARLQQVDRCITELDRLLRKGIEA